MQRPPIAGRSRLRTIENVLVREPAGEEVAGVRVVPGAVIVYVVDGGTISSSAAVT
ncbi:hypothetical protein ACFW3Z_18510 [Nocardiopsis alba]|uniref:hypothetical protein n=1 Tax=Nocardiopsis alba TaxID=53437 RepID=UPI0033F6D3C8